MNDRKTLISTGEHIGAVHLLGADYTDEEYIEAVRLAREAGIGPAYANKMLGADVLKGVEEDEGEATVKAAERRLRARGVDPKKANYAQYREALCEVSS